MIRTFLMRQARANIELAGELAQESQDDINLYGKEIKKTLGFQSRELREGLHLLWANLFLLPLGMTWDDLDGR